MSKDDIVCVSPGGGYQRPKDIQQHVEIRANWARARKEMGPTATNIVIHAQLNPNIDVSASLIFTSKTLQGCDYLVKNT